MDDGRSRKNIERHMLDCKKRRYVIICRIRLHMHARHRRLVRRSSVFRANNSAGSGLSAESVSILNLKPLFPFSQTIENNGLPSPLATPTHNHHRPNPHLLSFIFTLHCNHGRYPDVPRHCRHPHRLVCGVRRSDGCAHHCHCPRFFLCPQDERWRRVRGQPSRRSLRRRKGMQRHVMGVYSVTTASS